MNNQYTDDKIIKEKLEYIGLDLDNIPDYLIDYIPLNFNSSESYEEEYKVYKDISVNDVQILITPSDRLTSLNEKYKLAEPLAQYLDKNDEEKAEKFSTFISMINNVKIEDIIEIENEQKQIMHFIPYEIKYKNNFVWEIYYSDYANKYFMLVPSMEINNPELFYVIKKQIECRNENKDERIFIPISHMNYSGRFLNPAEISDLENYIWYFTKKWPNIYEVEYKGNMNLNIVGELFVFEKISSIYKIELQTKKDSAELYKLLKALFIISTSATQQYDFKLEINENGGIDVKYNDSILKYDDLPDFINSEVSNKREVIQKEEKHIEEDRTLLFRYNRLSECLIEEYLQKQKQISLFLECKKTFLGKVKYYFKSNTKIKKINKKYDKEEKKEEEKHEYFIENKEQYTIEDLIDVCTKYEAIINDKKRLKLDIKAIENKIANLNRKIDNAEIYINEIEKHKRNIFDFWKFTNKDEVPWLNEAEQAVGDNKEKLTKTFEYETDIEDLGNYFDELQRRKLSKNETDAIYISQYILNSLNAIDKNNNTLNYDLNKLKEEYKKYLENVNEVEFDIFGSISEDRTQIKKINNKKHREIEKDLYKILNINTNTDISIYTDNIRNYLKLLNEAFNKIKLNKNISAYKLTNYELKNIDILNLNPLNEIQNIETNSILYKFNLNEEIPILFFTNIVFYENFNKTLPIGMNLSSNILINFEKIKRESIKKEEFNINIRKNDFEYEVKKIKVIEYNIYNSKP